MAVSSVEVGLDKKPAAAKSDAAKSDAAKQDAAMPADAKPAAVKPTAAKPAVAVEVKVEPGLDSSLSASPPATTGKNYAEDASPPAASTNGIDSDASSSCGEGVVAEGNQSPSVTRPPDISSEDIQRVEDVFKKGNDAEILATSNSNSMMRKSFRRFRYSFGLKAHEK